jgi:acetyl-CoA carboxylase biotin carboxylase subunit
MKNAGAPVVPGSEGIVTHETEAREVAKNTGYPVLIKASAGGGGKGMRIVHNREGLLVGFRAAQAEALAAFGNGAIYVERFIDNPRHIGVQVLADRHGHTFHLQERECSVQRRHQKLIEEAPSPALTKILRKRVCKAATLAAEAADYEGAGTVEFILDDRGEFYFMEMNTRIQVEHPVTEMITGVDVVNEQIRIAGVEELAFRQKDVNATATQSNAASLRKTRTTDSCPRPGSSVGSLAPVVRAYAIWIPSVTCKAPNTTSGYQELVVRDHRHATGRCLSQPCHLFSDDETAKLSARTFRTGLCRLLADLDIAAIATLPGDSGIILLRQYQSVRPSLS